MTFYAHWSDVLSPAPMNTVPPEPGVEHDINQGFQMPTVVLRSPCGEPCNVTFQNNVFTLFTVPFPTSGSRGIDFVASEPAYDVGLGDGPIVVYAYLSAHPVPTVSSASEAGRLTNFGLMPLVNVDALWETGRHPGHGVPIAAGKTESTVNMIYVPGGDPVYEIKIVMGRFIDTVPAGEGTLLTLRVNQLAASNAELQQSNWRLRSGPEYPWRIVVPVENPLVTRGLRSSVENDTATIRWAVKAAWGAYDVDASTFQLRLEANGQRILMPPTSVEYAASHDTAVRTLYANWALPFDRLNGSREWAATGTVQNLQHSTALTDETTVVLTHFEGTSRVPGLGLLAAFIGVAAALWVRRRGAF